MRKVLSGTLVVLLLAGTALPAAAVPTSDGPASPAATSDAPGDDGGATELGALALAPAAAASLRPRLELGSRGPSVVHVQQVLGVTPASGYYGPLTRTAVKKLQRTAGRKPTGRVTGSTWTALAALATYPGSTVADAIALAPAAAAALRPRLALGSRGPAVVHVQQVLGVTPASGYYGPLTRTAVKKLQRAAGRKPTGRVTGSTWTALAALATDAGTRPSPSPSPSPEPTPSASPTPTPTPSAPTPLTPEQAAAGQPTLRQGMGPGDPAVVHVQRFLRVTPDSGYFGTLTRAAVTAYQQSLGITPTGTVGPQTWAAILAGRSAGTPTPSPSPTASTSPTPGPTPGPPVGDGPAQIAVAFAMAQVGKRYVLGGNGPDVFDCSGLVQQAYLAAGIRLPRLASQQRFAGNRVELADLAPGDLLYYQDGSSPRRGHISMYAGDGLAVEAANPRRGVRVRPLDQAWYRDRFVAAVRIA